MACIPPPVVVDWIPSQEAYIDRLKFTLPPDPQCNPLPAGFPTQVSSELVWTGADLQPTDYMIKLSAADIAEIETAMALFKSTGQGISTMNRATFPLPTLGARLLALGKSLYYGRGFFVLRGLDPTRYSSEENVLLYVGVSCWIAEKRGRQDEHNNMLLHLVDLTAAVAPDEVRQAPYSNVQQPFHTDIGDILALYALGQAYKGGKSKLASTGMIYNDLAKTRPDRIATLQSPSWVFDSFGRTPAYTKRALLFNQGGKMIFAFSRRILTGSKVSPRSPGIPAMTHAQADALDAVHFSAEKHSIVLDSKRGDMLFWNNTALVHARQGFADGGPENQRRHLLRLWLRDEARAWETPEPLKAAWKTAYGGTDASEEKWPLEPILDRDHVTTQLRSSGHG